MASKQQPYRKSHRALDVVIIGSVVSLIPQSLCVLTLNAQSVLSDYLLSSNNAVVVVARLISFVLILIALALALGVITCLIYTRFLKKDIEKGKVAIIKNLIGIEKVSEADSVWVIPIVESYKQFDCRVRPLERQIQCFTSDPTKITVKLTVSWQPDRKLVMDVLELKLDQEQEVQRIVDQLVTHLVGRRTLIQLQDELDSLETRLLSDMARRFSVIDSMKDNGIRVRRIQILKLDMSDEMTELLRSKLIGDLKETVETKLYGRATR